MGKKLLLIGGGGHCRAVADSAFSTGVFEEIGIVEKNKTVLSDLPIVGMDENISDLAHAGWTDAFITVGGIGNTFLRRRLYRMVKDAGFRIPTIIDTSAVVSKFAILSEGVYVGKGTLVNAGAVIETCAIINTGAIVEHECRIGAFSHISPGAILCGMVKVGHDTHIGAGTVVRQLLEIGNDTVIGAGSVVVASVPDGVTAYGNPCKVMDR